MSVDNQEQTPYMSLYQKRKADIERRQLELERRQAEIKKQEDSLRRDEAKAASFLGIAVSSIETVTPQNKQILKDVYLQAMALCKQKLHREILADKYMILFGETPPQETTERASEIESDTDGIEEQI